MLTADFARKTRGFELFKLQGGWLISRNRNSHFKITNARWDFINSAQPGTILEDRIMISIIDPTKNVSIDHGFT